MYNEPNHGTKAMPHNCLNSITKTARTSLIQIAFLWWFAATRHCYTHTSALPMRACPSGPAPGLVGYRSGAISIGPVQDRFWHVGTRPYGHEKNLDYDKTTLVAFQASLLLGGAICGSGKLALADISTRSTSTEGRELPGCRLWRHWWHRRLSTTASGAVGGDGMAPWRLSVLQCPINLPRIHCM